MKNKWLIVLVAGLLSGSATAGVVAAWDFEDGAGDTSSSGWTSFATGSNAASTVNFTGDDALGDGSITLTQITQQNILRQKSPSVYLTNAVPLLAAGDDVFADGPDGAGLSFALSGLVEGQEYRLQFYGNINKLQSARNLVLTIGSSSAALFADPSSGDATSCYGGTSGYITFTADASGTAYLDFSEDQSGQKVVGGLIVETIPALQPDTPPVITHTSVIEGGTNMVMTWTSHEGQLFDIVKSTDLKNWKTIVDDMPAAVASTQTTYTVALGEGESAEFYQVWSVDGRPPNIILLFADDLGYGDLACYGHPYSETPNLDKLATQGTLFRKFNVTGMTCNPSRTGILSSWHPNAYPLKTADYGFNQAAYGSAQDGYVDHPTVMELLHNAGYKTGHFGKWHIGPVETNGTYGIDEVIVSGGGGNDPRGRDEAIYADAINFIVANQNTNFYVNVMGRVTHNPVIPRPDLVASAGYTNLYTYFDRNDFAGQQLQGIFDGVIANGGDITNGMASYLTEVYYLDQFIGELLATLDELGLRENTIIAFSSDQGAAVPSYDVVPVPEQQYNLVGWSGGLRGQKHDQHEGGIRSPFILRWPGHVPVGKINHDSIISALDWLPTLCSIAGVDISGMDVMGENVRDIWEGSDRSRNGPQFWNSSMKKDDWRIYFNGGSTNAYELYDLSTDFAETNNLVNIETNVVSELTQIWADWEASLP